MTKLLRGYTSLDALADCKRVRDRRQLHRCPMYNAEHPPADFLAISRERYAVNRRNRVIVYRSKNCDQRRQAVSLAGVFVAPGTTWMKAENAPCEIVGKNELSRI